jgi:hypothetical protein
MQEALFYGFSLERHLPDGHMLRRIDRQIFARDPAYNSRREPATFVARAGTHSSSREREREAKPFFRERPIQGFFNTIDVKPPLRIAARGH